MKKFILILLSVFSLLLLFFCVAAFGSSDDLFSQSFSTQIMQIQNPDFFPVKLWSTDFWISISLIVSEVAAFLPTKASGILHFVARALRSIFQSK